MPNPSKIYTIPPTVSFTDTLASGLIKEVGDNPEKLASYLILLPTRRACRSVQEAFLRHSHDKPIMLPRLHPIGDVDGEELFISGTASQIDKIPPAMPSLMRQILLSKLIAGMPQFSNGPEQDMRLANALGMLMDQIYTEDLDLSTLPHIIDGNDFAEQWQITLNFLEILSINWPEILKEHGMIDAADRRNRLINALHHHWEQTPPNHPVIAAGSTGSIPSTTNLLKTISALPQGSVILPGLDQNMTDTAWNMVEEGHPQNTLKELLINLDSTRQDIKTWTHVADITTTIKAREKFISHVMSPPDYTHEWQKVHLPPEQKNDLETTLKNVQQIDCDTPQTEAQTIAVLLREVLEHKNETAALITPNRYLARRVAASCQRWGIEVDDSGGQSLSETPIGIYLKLIMQVVLTQAAPVSLLALLKHNLCQGANFENFRRTTRYLDIGLCRGLKPISGFSGLRYHYETKLNDEKNKHKPHPDVLKLIDHLEPMINPLIKKFEGGKQDFSKILNMHLEIAEQLSSSQNEMGEFFLWKGDAGEAAANFLSDLKSHTSQIQKCNAHDYLAILDHFMKSVSVRSKYGTHPHLMILGQLEARLIQADRIILSGLNEGSWPPDPGHDPWMSRPMRVNFGLPKPERSITLAAHDFVQAFCGKEVFLTRAIREDGTPTVPARWLQRIDTFMKAVGINPDIIRTAPHLGYVDLLDKVGEAKPVSRPAPKPPKAVRPDHLSVTKIETWMKDPYSIYAGSVLNLYALEPLEKEIGAVDRGNILHNVMEKFTKKFPKDITDTTKEDFIQIARDVLAEQNHDESEWNFWLPRMKRLADWLIPHEQEWRTHATFGKSEIKGTITITKGLDKPFTLTGVADRVDRMNTGGVAIIDYKSGGQYYQKRMQNGDTPQLALEAMIVTEGGFEQNGIHEKQADYIGYWTLTGAAIAGEVTAIDDRQKLQDIIKETQEGLTNLIHSYEDKTVPFLAIPRLDNAPRFNDYEHLERVKEWAALDENNEEAA